MNNRITCGDCESCRQCFEEDSLINIRQYTKESWKDFKNKTACITYFKEKDEH